MEWNKFHYILSPITVMFVFSRIKRNVSIVSANIKLLRFQVAPIPETVLSTSTALQVYDERDVGVVPDTVLTDIKSLQSYISNGKYKKFLVPKDKFRSLLQHTIQSDSTRLLNTTETPDAVSDALSPSILPALSSFQTQQLSVVARDIENAPSISIDKYVDTLNAAHKVKLTQSTSPNVPIKPAELSEEEKTFHEYVRTNDLDAAQRVLESNPQFNINYQLGKGVSALHTACIHGYLEMIRLLLSYNADINLRSSNGSTALHWAAGNGHAECVEYLLQNGADPTLTSSTWCVDVFGKDSGQLPLHWAVASGHTKCVELLLAHYPESAGKLDEKLNTPIELAQKDGHIQTIQVLEQSLNRTYIALDVQEVEYDLTRLLF